MIWFIQHVHAVIYRSDLIISTYYVNVCSVSRVCQFCESVKTQTFYTNALRYQSPVSRRLVLHAERYLCSEKAVQLLKPYFVLMYLQAKEIYEYRDRDAWTSNRGQVVQIQNAWKERTMLSCYFIEIIY